MKYLGMVGQHIAICQIGIADHMVKCAGSVPNEGGGGDIHSNAVIDHAAAAGLGE